MEIFFSRHARRQMRWRQISEAEVRAVLSEPDLTEPTGKGRKNALRTFGERRLSVTYREEANRLVIVTVVDKRD